MARMFNPGDSLVATATIAAESQNCLARNSRWERSQRKFLVGSLVLVLLSLPFIPAFERGGSPMDEGSLLLYPELIQHGKIPYRDFETFYGPANIYFLAATYSFLGANISVERGVGFLYRALVLLLVFALVSRWNTAVAAACTALAGWILLLSQLAAYSWFGGVACIFGSFFLLVNPNSNARVFLGGLLGGAAVLYRVDLGPAVIISTVPLFQLICRPRRVRYLAGFAVGSIPLILLVCVAGPQQMLNNLFLYPVFYSSPGRHLPIFSVDPDVIGLFFAHLIASATNLVAGIVGIGARRRDVHGRLLLALALLGVALTPQAMQRLDVIHLTSAAFISLGLLPLSLLVLASRDCAASPNLKRVLFASFGILATIEFLAPELTAYFKHEFKGAIFSEKDEQLFVQHNGRVFPFYKRTTTIMASRLLDRIEKLSVPGESLFIGPGDLRRTNCTDTFLYYMLPQLRPATYFLEMNPFSANRPGSRLAEDVKDADWLVLNREFDFWNEPNRSREFQSDVPNQIVKEHFEVVGEFGNYLLFHRKMGPKVAPERPAKIAYF
jgi:hypothetical protein